MLSRNQIQHVRQLHQAKFRNSRKAFIAEGPKIVAEVLKSGWSVEEVYGTPDWMEENSALIDKAKTKFQTITLKELERMSALKTPNQVVAVVSSVENVETEKVAGESPLLVLDGISDPGNLGTIIRSADWFGWRKVICSIDCVELFNPKVIQSTMGSFLRVAVRYADLPPFLSSLPRDTIFGTSMEGDDIYQTDVPGNICLVIGSESHGISQPVRSCIAKWISIPGIPGHGDSLNAAVATSVMISEISRKLRWS